MSRADELAGLYRDIFEIDARGAALLEDLVARFARAKVYTDGGIDAVLKTYHANGQRSVVDHILTQINKANGVREDRLPIEGEPDE